jgi:hypothetical protein
MLIAAALALTTVLAAPGAPTQVKSITCAVDQFDRSERLTMGKTLAVDIAWPSPTSNPDKRLVQKTILLKIGACPGFDAMPDPGRGLYREPAAA